ncbi:hypothetical protein BKN14_03565 [Candidatus Gracilibacteria bacterium HOT-871]|nr:hypothetical protein BKN14_03565 [Candidatus Gracilibacteria bacterium HOT-871]
MTKNKNFSKIQHFSFGLSFIYLFFLVNLSFSPIIEIWPTTTTYINFLPFQGLNYQSDFIIGHFLLLIPAGFLLPVFIKNKKNVILTGLGIAIGIEILQLIFIKLLGLIDLTIGKTVTTDEMMINFVGFMIGFLCFLIFAYLLKVLGIKTKELT